MGKILHHRLVPSVAFVLLLVMAPLVIVSLGVRPAGATSADYFAPILLVHL